MQASLLRKTTDLIGSVRLRPVDHAAEIFPSPHILLELPGSRKLAYSEYGCKTGMPLLYFHDNGSSRLECALLHTSAVRKGYRLIAVDRPGIGYSDYHANASATDFCNDLLYLTKQLKLEKFGLLSMGAGGIYALTAAHLFPTRIKFHLCFAGIHRNTFASESGASYASNYLRGMLPAAVKLLVRFKHSFFHNDPSSYLERLSGVLGYCDRKILSSPKVANLIFQDQRECFRQGSAGLAQDTANCLRNLDFDLADIKVPVMIWQGSADTMSSRAACESLAVRLPQASFHRVSNQGHFFFLNSMEDIYRRIESYPPFAASPRPTATRRKEFLLAASQPQY